MKRIRNVLVGVLSVLAGAGGAHAFRSGSDGSYGPINVTSGTNTLNLPADGIFNATTITVAAGAVLKFNKNALNTPVYLLATGDIVINGTVDVSGGAGTASVGGAGGPGGYDGGAPSIAGSEPGAGHGPGGGLGGYSGQTACVNDGPNVAGAGVYGEPPQSASFRSARDGNVYGSPLLMPLTGGSGGGGLNGRMFSTGTPCGSTSGGGGGGGAILLASDTRVVVAGTVRAWGGSGATNLNHGSGGAIRIVAPAVTGTGTLDVVSWSPTTGGNGRIRVDLIDRSAFGVRFSPTTVASVGAFMQVFPSPVPRLDIVHAAGRDIPEGTSTPVVVTLPFNGDPNQNVVVQGRDFQGLVPIRVRLIPDAGDAIDYNADIDMSAGNPATVTVPVVVPQNVPVRIQAWTR